MLTLSVAGKDVTITGAGAEDDPFIVTGIEGNPSLAAAAEEAILDHWLGADDWLLIESRLNRPKPGQTMAVLKIRSFDENEDVVQGQVWFDISEAFNR